MGREATGMHGEKSQLAQVLTRDENMKIITIVQLFILNRTDLTVSTDHYKLFELNNETILLCHTARSRVFKSIPTIQ